MWTGASPWLEVIPALVRVMTVDGNRAVDFASAAEIFNRWVFTLSAKACVVENERSEGSLTITIAARGGGGGGGGEGGEGSGSSDGSGGGGGDGGKGEGEGAGGAGAEGGGGGGGGGGGADGPTDPRVRRVAMMTATESFAQVWRCSLTLSNPC